MDETRQQGRNAGAYSVPVGQWEAIALHDGVLERDRPDGFVHNVSDDEVGEAFAQAGMARDKLTLTFTPLAVRTGDGVVLIDTGFGENGPPGTGKLVANLRAAGIEPGDVTTVIISHCHGDHVLGLRGKDGSQAFPNARLLVPEGDWAHWMDDAKMAAAPEAARANFEAVRRSLPSDPGAVRRFHPDEELLPGFVARDAAGHTPGMAAIEISNGGDTLLYVADITNTPLLFARHPDWQAMFDMDPERATATRRRMLDAAARDHTRLFFFHAPFPGFGTVAKNGDGYDYLPALWRSA